MRDDTNVALTVRLLVFSMIVFLSTSAMAQQGVFQDVIEFSDFNLKLVPYADVPTLDSRINSIVTTRPDDVNPYVVTENGRIYSMTPNGNNTGSLSVWFDMQAALTTVPNNVSFNPDGGQRGLQSVAFHPEFNVPASPGYGKFYTSFVAREPVNPAGFNYLGASVNGPTNPDEDSVLSEWTYDFNSGNSSNYRELFRIRMPVYEHPIKQVAFNPFSSPGDADYGLLYINHGDSGQQDPNVHGGGQNLNDALGKTLRINPLQNGANRYSVTGNLFATDGNPNTLAEVYAMGFRNPHNMSFNQGSDGETYLVVGDIGRDNVEEVNLVNVGGNFGGNFGWGNREGPFLQVGAAPLPANEWQLNDYIYPAAAYDHDGGGGVAIASSFVINNGSDPNLHSQFIYTNFASQDGDFYHSDWDEMVGAHTQLANNELPGALNRATTYRLRMELDHDNNPITPPQIYEDFRQLVGGGRTDTRFGRGFNGEMYVSSKENGTIYLVTNSVPLNQLSLTVDRSTGVVSVAKSGDSDMEIDGISVQSVSGSLAPGGFQSVGAGWTFSANNNSTKLTQLNEDGSLVLTDMTPVVLGNIYDPAVTSFGGDLPEDVQFIYTGPGGDQLSGFVNYVGEHQTPNTIVLTVDRASGEASMMNQTPFPQEVDAYTIFSPSGSLDPNGWATLESQGVDDGDWSPSPATEDRLTELQEDGTTTFDNATPYSLGTILASGGLHDLGFQFLLVGEELVRDGIVKYILAGDYNDDGIVNTADYTVWRNNLGTMAELPNDMTSGIVTSQDYEVWKSSFGNSFEPLGTAASVPESGSLVIALGLFGIAGLATRRIQFRQALVHRYFSNG